MSMRFLLVAAAGLELVAVSVHEKHAKEIHNTVQKAVGAAALMRKKVAELQQMVTVAQVGTPARRMQAGAGACAWANNTCAPSTSFWQQVSGVLSPAAIRELACSMFRSQAPCVQSSAPYCVWDSVDMYCSEEGGQGKEDIIMQMLAVTGCGWLSRGILLDPCASFPATGCTGSCKPTTGWQPASGAMCTSVLQCRAKEPIVNSGGLCLPGVDLLLAQYQCTDQHEDWQNWVSCIKLKCPILGQAMAAAMLDITCSIESQSACVALSDCIWSSGCFIDTAAVTARLMMAEVPDSCPLKQILIDLQACTCSSNNGQCTELGPQNCNDDGSTEPSCRPSGMSAQLLHALAREGNAAQIAMYNALNTLDACGAATAQQWCAGVTPLILSSSSSTTSTTTRAGKVGLASESLRLAPKWASLLASVAAVFRV